MTLVSFLVTFLILALVFYLIEKFAPLNPPFRTVLRIVELVVAVFLILALFGVYTLPFALK